MISVMSMMRRGCGLGWRGSVNIFALFAFILSAPSLSLGGPASGGTASRGPALGSLAQASSSASSSQSSRVKEAKATKTLAEQLKWDLPHDRAAQYDQFDARTGASKGQFWLLGCEFG